MGQPQLRAVDYHKVVFINPANGYQSRSRRMPAGMPFSSGSSTWLPEAFGLRLP